MKNVTRRSLIRAGLGAGLAAAFRARAFAREFWDERPPEQWTPAEIKRLLNKSPWAKEASIDDRGQIGNLGSPRSAARRGGRGGTAEGETPAGNSPKITWRALVRWESAAPLSQALKGGAPKDAADFYVLNVIGNLPSALPPEREPEYEQALGYLKDSTTLSHKGDQVHVDHVIAAPANQASEAGTRFYFSRRLALMPEDREATFATRIGPLDVKCKFTLREMLYHGKLEL